MVEDVVKRLEANGCKFAQMLLTECSSADAGSRAIHRGDYQDVLLKSAEESGVKLFMGADVARIVPHSSNEAIEGQETVFLKDGRQFSADVVVGADGLWSICREYVLDRTAPPQETGELAFRGTFSREQLASFQDPQVDELLEASNIQVWLGPDRHAVFYPLRNHSEYNLVLLCPDDLPTQAKTAMGSLEEMRQQFHGWDSRLSKVISCLSTALKWKLLHFRELDKWTRGAVALLGDSSHPTLPHQGQGAAMAVEDGAVIGMLLGQLQHKGIAKDSNQKRDQICGVLKLYEDLRKKRTEVNVAGADLTREFYHLFDGERQRTRDAELAELHKSDWTGPSQWNWADASYQKELLGFDVLADAQKKFDRWWSAEARL